MESSKLKKALEFAKCISKPKVVVYEDMSEYEEPNNRTQLYDQVLTERIEAQKFKIFH